MSYIPLYTSSMSKFAASRRSFAEMLRPSPKHAPWTPRPPHPSAGPDQVGRTPGAPRSGPRPCASIEWTGISRTESAFMVRWVDGRPLGPHRACDKAAPVAAQRTFYDQTPQPTPQRTHARTPAPAPGGSSGGGSGPALVWTAGAPWHLIDRLSKVRRTRLRRWAESAATRRGQE